MLLLCAIGDIRAVSRSRDPRGRPARAYPADRTGGSRRADQAPARIGESCRRVGPVGAWRNTTSHRRQNVGANSGITDAP
jgi:hypothetical protein